MKLRTTAALLLCALSLNARALDFGGIPPEEISVYVKDLQSGRIIEEHRADESMNPASTMKLVTAFAAFRALGRDYRWTTELKSDGRVNGDTLEGDIYWVGSGDPMLDQDGLVALQQQLRDKGIVHINGRLVLDRSVWGETGSADDFGSDADEAFMTAPDPNMLAYKVVWVKPERGTAGGVDITTNPPLPEIALKNQVSITGSAAGCNALQNYMRARYTGGVLHASGKIPESCLGQEMFVNMLSMQVYAEKSFVNQWRKAGGTISDGLKTAAAPAGAAVLAGSQSKPLAEVLTEMNKHSNNLIARTVFLKLGEHSSDGLTVQAAKNTVRNELAAAGVDNVGQLVLENGSGLSRKERATARMLGQVLEKAYFSPFKQDFVNTLPIAGTDGTLKKRFRQAGLPLRLKTGTLKDVRALAGYWLGENPKIVVVLINSSRSNGYLKDMDKMVSRIVLPGGDDWVEAGLLCEKRQAV